MSVAVRAFTSPTLVLLAFDWPEGDDHRDFLGFARAIGRLLNPGQRLALEDGVDNRPSAGAAAAVADEEA
jgi:hypothetical protein